MWQKAKNYYHLLQALIANSYYGFPGRKLKVIGVTGTSGKTTTSLLIYEMLKAAGLKVSVLSSIQAVIGGKEYDTGFHVTTPDPHVLPKFLKQALSHGDTHFVLEVSSHGLDQNRVAFVPFEIGVLSSLAHEHLDYHKTMVNYAKAKFKLMHHSKTAVIPVSVLDETLNKALNYEKLSGKLVTFGLNTGDVTQKKWNLKLELPGDYNLVNALAAVCVGNKLGIDNVLIKKSLESFKGLPGRFEEIANDRGLKIIIDFAHKPDALESVLSVANRLVTKNNKVIVMYGCASERDVLKRPIMGEISGRLADITVLTDEDPRREDSMKIINEIAAGCASAGAVERHRVRGNPPAGGQISEKKHVFYKIPDRQEAIGFIINTLSKRGDIVLLCGKGHEKSMNYNGTERPWSEHSEVKKALKNIQKK